jgi:RNA polymerase sigma-70 factor, ECF subfamily
VRPEDLDSLFRTHGRSVFRRAGAILGDAEAAKDVMQEVFLRAMNARAEIAASESALWWLHRVTTNICLNRIRDASRRQRILNAATSGEEPAASYGTHIDTVLTVRALLRHVPEELQEIAIYYFVDQMSQEEISSQIGVPRRTVSYRLQQFRELAQTIVRAGGALAS